MTHKFGRATGRIVKPGETIFPRMKLKIEPHVDKGTDNGEEGGKRDAASTADVLAELQGEGRGN